jgi:hypothetical protein
MVAEPAELQRPLVIMDGWLRVGGGDTVKREIKKLTGATDDDILLVTYNLGGTPESLAARTIRRVEEKWPSDDPDWTTEVDVIGYSNGGIYARVAALPPQDGSERKKLRVNRMFTIGSPHRGVRFGIARLGIDTASRAVQPGSKLLQYLDENLPDAEYELTC